jgi:hypothetical protein
MGCIANLYEGPVRDGAVKLPGRHIISNSNIPKPVVPSENLIRWIRSRKENRIMIETDGDLLQTSARIYVGLLSFA